MWELKTVNPCICVYWFNFFFSFCYKYLYTHWRGFTTHRKESEQGKWTVIVIWALLADFRKLCSFKLFLPRVKVFLISCSVWLGFGVPSKFFKIHFAQYYYIYTMQTHTHIIYYALYMRFDSGIRKIVFSNRLWVPNIGKNDFQLHFCNICNAVKCNKPKQVFNLNKLTNSFIPYVVC